LVRGGAIKIQTRSGVYRPIRPEERPDLLGIVLRLGRTPVTPLRYASVVFRRPRGGVGIRVQVGHRMKDRKE
jgi:hypothetical protein